MEGFAEIALDATTAGSGSLVKGAVKTTVKAVGRRALKEVAEEGGEQVAKREAKNALQEQGKRVTGEELKRLRKEFNEKVKPEFWKHEAKCNPSKYSKESLERMKRGDPPVGSDGKPIELHHKVPLSEGGTNDFDNLQPMTRTEHREGDNFKKNHPNVGRRRR